MDFSFVGDADSEGLAWFRSGIRRIFERNGDTYVSDPHEASLVFCSVLPDHPGSFMDLGKDTYVVVLAEVPPPFGPLVEKGYSLLVRTMANLFIGLVPEGDPHPSAHFITPEQGHYAVPGSHPSEACLQAAYDRIHPLAACRRVVENIFQPDLPESLQWGDEITSSIIMAGKALDRLGLLPPPFPVEEHFSPEELRKIKDRYGVQGLSYGNLSARLDESRFWMSASGVDKSKMSEIGRDLLLVAGFDPDRNAMLVSVPPGVQPRRASVDAIEHWMIYRNHPEVRAILHVHAWMDGVPSTDLNYPCGSYELAEAVAGLVRESPESGKAVVGLKNHGLTILGSSMEEILVRVGERLYQPVPMS